ncbi:MAG: hypothetical protein ACPGJI_01875 [Kangiellaceae bacterium]
MSSSISNSSTDFDKGSSSRAIYKKISLAILFGMGIAMALIQGITVLMGGTTHNIMGRVVEARAALPKIVQEEQDLVMVFGSSMVEAGFAARQFDKEMSELGKNVKSFNFGFGGLNPFFQDYLSRRIRDEFVRNDKRLKLAVIEFNPFQTTQTRWNGAISTVDSFITMLASNEELFAIGKEDPTRGFRLFNIKYIRNDISAEMATSFIGQGMFPAKRPKRLDDPEEIREKQRELGKELQELFAKEYPDYKSSRWSYPWQGAGTIPQERSDHTLAVFKEYYAALQSHARLTNDLQNRINRADIEELNFEPLLIESFIEIVENFKQFSDKVEIVMLPRNTKWVNYTEEGKKRLNKTISIIEKATKLKIESHQDLDVIDPTMFSDTTHLARYSGDVPYTHYLVMRYKNEL